MRNNCFSYWKYHCTSVAMLDAPFLCQTGGSWFKKRIVINVQQNRSCEGKRQRCTSFYLSVCVWNTAVCRHAEKVSSYWVFSQCVWKWHTHCAMGHSCGCRYNSRVKTTRGYTEGNKSCLQMLLQMQLSQYRKHTILRKTFTKNKKCNTPRNGISLSGIFIWFSCNFLKYLVRQNFYALFWQINLH